MIGAMNDLAATARLWLFACQSPVRTPIFPSLDKAGKQRQTDFRFCHCGAVAQLGERYNGIVEVVGSIPSGSTI